MHKISRRKFIAKNSAGAVALCALGGSSSVNAKQSGGKLDHSSVKKLAADLQQFIPRMMQHVGVPGLSIAVIRDAKMVWSQGFGVKNNETREPVTSDTP